MTEKFDHAQHQPGDRLPIDQKPQVSAEQAALTGPALEPGQVAPAHGELPPAFSMAGSMLPAVHRAIENRRAGGEQPRP